MDATTIGRPELIKLILATEGREFQVTFIKKDGSVRVMNGNLGTKEEQDNGRRMSYNPLERGLLPVRCCDAGAYRMINLKTMTEAVVDGVRFVPEVEEEVQS